MKPDPLTIRNTRRSRLWGQTQLLYKLDERGQRAYDDAGEQILDLDQAPAVLADIGVPPRLREATFASAEFGEADSVKQWFVDILNGIDAGYLALFVGDGSNYIAAAALRNAVKRAKTVAWYSWHDFTKRYTDGIERSRTLDGGNTEETAVAAQESEEARDEDFNLRYVYEVLAITDFDINDVRDFAVPDITSMLRNRSDWGLTTIITVAEVHSGALEMNSPGSLGSRGSLLRQFESEAQVFDGRQ